MRLQTDAWRWAGGPWYIRAGKGLAANATEAVVELKEPPKMLFDELPGPPPERNLIRFRLTALPSFTTSRGESQVGGISNRVSQAHINGRWRRAPGRSVAGLGCDHRD